MAEFSPLERVCDLEGCGARFVPSRAEQRFCQDAHRSAAWRRQRNQEAAPAPAPTPRPTSAPTPAPQAVPRTPRQALEAYVQTVRGTPLARDYLLDCLALQEALTEFFADPAIRQQVEALAAAKRTQLLRGQVDLEHLDQLDLSAVSDPACVGVGLAAVVVDSKRIAVGVVAACQRT